MNDFCQKKNQTEIDFPSQFPLHVFVFLSSIVYGKNFLQNVNNIPWKYFSTFCFFFFSKCIKKIFYEHFIFRTHEIAVKPVLNKHKQLLFTTQSGISMDLPKTLYSV